MSQYILGPATTQIELQKNIPLGIAGLDSSAKVSSNQLPSYVDDVLEYNSMSLFPAEGESGKIYIAKDTNITYRWSGSSYVPIGSDLALGETSSTAYRGDRGAAAYAAAVTNVATTPVANSSYLITSGGVAAALHAMVGATSSTAGTSGLVPAPAAGDDGKFLRGDGTWEEVSYTISSFAVSGTITNTSGAYSGTISDSRVSTEMVPFSIAYGTPSAIKDDVSITCNDGYISIACNNIVGSSTISVSILTLGVNSYTAAE